MCTCLIEWWNVHLAQKLYKNYLKQSITRAPSQVQIHLSSEIFTFVFLKPIGLNPFIKRTQHVLIFQTDMDKAGLIGFYRLRTRNQSYDIPFRTGIKEGVWLEFIVCV